MLEKLEKIREEGFMRIAESTNPAMLEAVRKELTGKKSSLQEVLKSLGGLDPDMRKSVGMKANEVKNLFADRGSISSRRRDRPDTSWNRGERWCASSYNSDVL